MSSTAEGGGRSNSVSSSPSPGRGGRGGRGKGRGRGGGRNNNNNKSNGSKNSSKGRGDDTTNNNNNNKPSTPTSKSNGGGRGGGGGRRRNFSARGGAAGRGNGLSTTRRGSNQSSDDDVKQPEENTIEETNPIEERVNNNMSDQDVLIAFGPHVRSGNIEAKRIHQEYLSNSNQKDFINNARKFLFGLECQPEPTDNDKVPQEENKSNNNAKVPNNGGNIQREAAQDQRPLTSSSCDAEEIIPINLGETQQKVVLKGPPPGLQTQLPVGLSISNNTNNNTRLPPGMVAGPPPGMMNVSTLNNNNNLIASSSQNKNNNALPPGSSLPPGMPPAMRHLPPGMPQIMKPCPPGMPPAIKPPSSVVAMSPPAKPSTSSILPAHTPPPTSVALPKATPAATTPAKPGKVWRTQTRCEVQPGRIFANEMPNPAFSQGSIFNRLTPAFSNNRDGTSITVCPRSELTARWVLPLPYLRNRALRRLEEQKSSNGAPQNLTIRDALKDLAVGLFRRGAMDSGEQFAIVSKEILAPKGGGNSSGGGGKGGRPSEDYFFNVDQRADSVFGTVPFYAPRTPGNVVFRLYFEDEPQTTLATGPCIRVIPSERDVDSVLRFILSNFKSKKTNGISSMNSLASVLQLFSAPVQQVNERFYDQARRVAWGCICEAQKVVEQAGETYLKKKREIKEKLEEQEEADKLMDQLPDLKSLGIDNEETASSNGVLSEIIDSTQKGEHNEKDKNTSSDAKAKLISEEYSVERKWREIQLMYASVLKAVSSNPSLNMILKRDLLSKIQLEYELWCPFIEAFAPNPWPRTNNEVSKLPGDISSFPQPVLKEHLKKCHESRGKMQKQILGFVPQSRPILPSAKDYQWKKNGRNFFKELSSAMNEIYRDEYAVSDKVWKRREKVRATIEHIVSTSGEFPAGTKVMVFGSSANGFGSPNSDLDLCLQVPQSATNFSKEEGGVEAMTNLASKFEEAGLTDVDTVRLTARIPIVKFNVPYKDDDEEILVECDLSLQNPLACLNTALLHAYSNISPTTCILASIIKRWAKSRDINNPAMHTLSSYGYVIMLLSFLTSCNFDKNGHVREKKSDPPSPILPNLQLVDPVWAENPEGPYREMKAKPKTKETLVQHPTEPNYFVNSYFYRSGLDGLTKFCSENHNAETALGALLASFFHYFAYDFDYKKHVVSLSTNHSSPPKEREVKAEEDGWSIFKTGLAIEDPFELFYDVAHVVKATNFQHIRKEFSLAYTKIVNAAYKSGNLPTGKEIIDMICEPVSTVSDEESSA